MATLGFQGEEVKALQEKVEFLKTSEEAKDYEIKKTKVLNGFLVVLKGIKRFVSTAGEIMYSVHFINFF